jgi:hypothetical protein
MKNRILVDSSPLVAILSPQDHYHQICLDTLKNIKPPLLTTWAVITETLWLIRHNQKAIESLFKMIERGLVQIDPLSDDAISWLGQFMLKYHDMGVQIADASLCYLAETYDLKEVFTLDRKDFNIYRIKNNRALKIIPFDI